MMKGAPWVNIQLKNRSCLKVNSVSAYSIRESLMLLLISFLIMGLWENGAADSESTIIRPHLTVAASNFPLAILTERNSSGYIINMKGISPLMIEWLSTRFNISYSVLQVNVKTFDGIENSGLVQYLKDGKCDLVMGAIIATYERLAFMDLTQGYFYTTNALMIPMPENENNLAAAVKPFQLSVWISLMVGILFVSFILWLSRRISYKKSKLKKNLEKPNKAPLKKEKFQAQSFRQSFYQIYVVEVLLNQGSECRDKRLAIRLIAGAWCLTCFVLVTSYNSVLISFVTSPNAVPLITSMNDLINMSKVHLIVEKGMGHDIVISTATDGIFKQFGDKLKTYKNSRCIRTDICVDQVKLGGHVYVNSLPAVLQAMKIDFKTTNKCNLAIANQHEYSWPWSWALTKNSRFTETINRGILEMRAFGLLDAWRDTYQADVHQCLEQADKIQRRSRSADGKTIITLKNLTSAFIVLIFGYFLSFLTFLVEQIVYYMKNETYQV